MSEPQSGVGSGAGGLATGAGGLSTGAGGSLADAGGLTLVPSPHLHAGWAQWGSFARTTLPKQKASHVGLPSPLNACNEFNRPESQLSVLAWFSC